MIASRLDMTDSFGGAAGRFAELGAVSGGCRTGRASTPSQRCQARRRSPGWPEPNGMRALSECPGHPTGHRPPVTFDSGRRRARLTGSARARHARPGADTDPRAPEGELHDPSPGGLPRRRRPRRERLRFVRACPHGSQGHPHPVRRDAPDPQDRPPPCGRRRELERRRSSGRGPRPRSIWRGRRPTWTSTCRTRRCG